MHINDETQLILKYTIPIQKFERRLSRTYQCLSIVWWRTYEDELIEYKHKKNKATLRNKEWNIDRILLLFLGELQGQIYLWINVNLLLSFLNHFKVKLFVNLDVLIGVNIGRNKTTTTAVEQDYTLGIEQFGCLADYLVINVSSPNTPGLRALQTESELKNLLTSIRKVCDKISCENPRDSTRKTPLILLKVAPDLDENEIKSISSIIRQPNTRIDGLIVSNTTIARMDTLKNEHRNETGGLSGRPLKEKALQTLRLFRSYTQGDFLRFDYFEIDFVF